MKVTFVITGLGTGGTEMMLFKLVQQSAEFRRGRIIALRGEGEMVARFRALGMRVEALGMGSALPNPVALVRLIAMLRRGKPDVVSTWLYHADLIGGLAARCAGVPVVWGVRSSDLPADSTKFATRAVVRVCAALSRHVPTVIACCSHRARAFHEGMGYPAEKFRVVPNGFDLERFRPDQTARSSVRAELRLPPDAPLVGLIARFDPYKNHEGFLEAAAAVIARLPGVHFLLVGGGVDQYNAPLVVGVRRLGLDGKVHLLGLRQDMPRLMASLDVVASASWTEAFSNVLGEAMACGIPCVVTDVGDSAYVVGDTGTVVPQGDMAGLADGMRCTLTLPAAERRTLGDRARARVTAHFEIGAVAREYERLFRQVAEGGV
jgi:glycosyltransferase involved in cell wall biosynthesis